MMSAVFLEGNARVILKGLPADWFHCVVTSPPYFGLRKYDGGEDVWSGNLNCRHVWGELLPSAGYRSSDTSPGKLQGRGTQERNNRLTQFCSLCGAWRGQLGAEPTPDAYIAHLVEICAEVKRVLRPDGVFWLNIGDSWASGKGTMYNPGGGGTSLPGHANLKENQAYQLDKHNKSDVLKWGCKPLDMILIPQLIALALRADGWYVRSQIIWSKLNPMPESVSGVRWEQHRVKVARSARAAPDSAHTQAYGGKPQGARDGREFADHNDEWVDCPGCPRCSPNDGLVLRRGSWRPTDSYEVLLMLTKTNRYFCDREAVREPVASSTIGRGPVDFGGAKGRSAVFSKDDPNFRNGSEQWGRTFDYRERCADGRNLRSVWTFPSQSFKGHHYAVFPFKLPTTCIQAATSERGCCPDCGSPYARVVVRPEVPHDGATDCKNTDTQGNTRRLALLRQAAHERGGEYQNTTKTVSWRPTCKCNAGDPVPCRVLDPFSGAGTTVIAADRLGRDAYGIDTSSEYTQMARDRLDEDWAKRNGHKSKSTKESFDQWLSRMEELSELSQFSRVSRDPIDNGSRIP